MYVCLEYRVSWVRVPPEAGKVTALGMLCCFALFVCLTLLTSFFLPSHLSFKNMYVCCTALMRPNQVETVLSAVAYSLVPHDD